MYLVSSALQILNFFTMATLLPRTLIALGLLLLAHAYALSPLPYASPAPYPSTNHPTTPIQLLLRLRTLFPPLPRLHQHISVLTQYIKSTAIKRTTSRYFARNHLLRGADMLRPCGRYGRAAADSVARVGWEGRDGRERDGGGEGRTVGGAGGEDGVCGYQGTLVMRFSYLFRAGVGN